MQPSRGLNVESTHDSQLSVVSYLVLVQDVQLVFGSNASNKHVEHPVAIFRL